MKTRMGGWWRLWIALAVLHALVVAGFTYEAWPSPTEVSDHPAYKDRLSDQSRALLNKLPKTGADGWEDAPQVVEMPNGARLTLAADIPKHSAEALAREYWQVIELEARSQQLNLLLKAVTLWFFPIMALCALGLTLRWIYAGFKTEAS